MSQPARHTVIDQWTGRHATALQAALRMSQDEMAALIGVAKRTIASWSERPEIVIRPELQRALDTAHHRADEPAKLRLRAECSGVLVTTSYVHDQAHSEVREDQIPIVIICGRDIVDVLRRKGYSTPADVAAWLDSAFPRRA